MYLKRLELHGFKTFASRTVLDFEGGVTGVVGPNGSGKSNLADAVRWALGEQSLRNVRCRQAEDLIFAGTTGTGARTGTGPRTASRAPMGMAEVMLTFDNGARWMPIDYEEVRIGRRVYRTGENEYLMNGVRVRLRDITDLLARAAIGSGGHLVIGQGLVDTMLSARPEERKTLVETLAGLRFYYNKREDAESKLRATEANLRNVDAMIAEAAPHLAVLSEQAAAYEGYRTVERELRDLLLLHYAHAYAAIAERDGRLGDELAAARRAVEEAHTAVAAAEQELAALRGEAGRRRREVSELRGGLRRLHDLREAATRELAVGRAKREGAAARLEDVRNNLPAVEARRQEAATDRASADEAAQAVAAERARLEASRAEVEDAVRAATARVAESERASRALFERRRALEGRAAAIAAERATIDRAEEAARAEERRLADDAQATTLGWDEARGAVNVARKALDGVLESFEGAKATEGQARLLAAAAAEKARTTAAGRRDAERQLAEAQARADGLRAWLQAMGGSKGGGTTVASALIAQPQAGPALAAALNALLPAQLTAYAMGVDEATAALDQGARGLLLAGRGGLTAEQQATLRVHLERAGIAPADIVGWGDTLATVDAPGHAAASLHAVLTTILVLRDVRVAWRVHELLRTPDVLERLVTLATLDGVALAPNGLLERPAGEGVAALERARELRAAEHAVEQVESRLAEAIMAADQAEEERARLAADAEAAARALRGAEQERAARRGELTAAERTEAQARREAQWASDRVRRAERDAAERTEQRATLAEQSADLGAQLATLTAEERGTATRYDEARRALQEATARRAEHGAALALVAERANDAGRRQRAAEETLSRLDDELRRATAIAASLETELRDSLAAEERLAARAREASAELQAIHERLRPLEAQLARAEERDADLERQLSELRPAAARAASAHEAAALARQRAAHERETLLAGLHADLGLGPEDLSAAQGSPPSGLQGRVKNLRARLGEYGPVNARAPEDLAAATERQAFLQAQATDLREGVARLRELIAEANGTVRERFGVVTGELDAQFRLYLQQLFGGGRGELTALYDEAGLPSGLDIAVQPPGKRTKDLALLSGGERALVGLALVFAMLAVRPVPFCVLDEAEAALDEANTLRVGEALRGLSERTQFVVITHNRGTMSQADALYGVTMAESGISQIAGIRLEDVEVVRRSRAG